MRGSGSRTTVTISKPCRWAAWVIVLWVSPAFAGFTTIKDATSGSEIDLWAALDLVAPNPGGPSTSWTSTAFLNSGAGGRRVDDASDQIWKDGVVTVSMTALFWGGSATPADTLGQQLVFDSLFFDGSVEDVPVPPVDGFGASSSFTVGGDGKFMLGDGSSSKPTAWSLAALNTPFGSGNVDRVVTFDVSGLDINFWNGTAYQFLKTAGPNSFIVAFDPGSDEDYQDMIILIEGPTPNPPCGVDGDCDDGNTCTIDFCNTFGGCIHDPAASGTTCDDGDACTTGDACDMNGDCVGTPVVCDNGLFCDGVETCDSTLGCVTGSNPCTDPALPFCDETNDTCVECLVDADCADGVFCNGAESCVNNVCQAGVDPCDDGVACTVDSCDEASDTCTNTPDNTLCDDGLFCNGAETCDSTLGCQTGSNPCTDPALPVCDETTDTCVQCLVDADCSDGLFCNGAEVCLNNVCQAGVDPCDDGVACTVDTCDEAADTCTNTPDNTLCDDGLFCNGAETCDSTLGCQTGSNPCTDPALSICDETTDTCVQCLVDADCSDGLFCNGAESCLNTVCQAGADPCVDGVACTVDTCDEATDTCANTPNDLLCDDGDACTEDLCDGVTGCAHNDCPVVVVDGAGMFAIDVTLTPIPPGSTRQVALKLTSPNFSCLVKYIDANGNLVDNPVLRPEVDWGTVTVSGIDIVPSKVGGPTVYEVGVECNNQCTSGPASGQTSLWADADRNGVVDVFDLFCVIDAFSGNFSNCGFADVDLLPCPPNGIIDVFDLFAVLKAFGGEPFPCSIPCGAACCGAPGFSSCQMLPSDVCIASGGVPQGPGTICFPSVCGSP